jgi:hypothetical protein
MYYYGIVQPCCLPHCSAYRRYCIQYSQGSRDHKFYSRIVGYRPIVRPHTFAECSHRHHLQYNGDPHPYNLRTFCTFRCKPALGNRVSHRRFRLLYRSPKHCLRSAFPYSQKECNPVYSYRRSTGNSDHMQVCPPPSMAALAKRLYNCHYLQQKAFHRNTLPRPNIHCHTT